MLGVVTSIYVRQNRLHFNTDTIYTDSKLCYTHTKKPGIKTPECNEP